jgi:hypothetical protein
MGKDAMRGLIGQIIRTIAPHTEADSAALVLQFLAAFGNVIGRRPHFQVEADYHAPNLFVALVGKSARGRKGTSWGHILEIFRRVDADWARKRVHPGLSTGEGLIETIADEDSARERDKRILVFEDEFSAVLRVMSRYGNTLSTTLRSAWDGRTLQVMTRQAPLRSTGAHISIIAQTTQHDLERYMGLTDVFNGFANRFLWGCVQRSKLLPTGGGLSEEELTAIVRQVRKRVKFARSLCDK